MGELITDIHKDKKKADETSTAGSIEIELIKASDLEAADEYPYSSDPYCIFALKRDEYKSKVIKNDLNPEWGENFTLIFNDIEEPLEIFVMDAAPDEAADGIEDDPLGDFTVNLRSLRN